MKFPKFKNLRNNALFLSCWYERSRPVHLACIGILLFSIMAILFLTVSTQRWEGRVKIWTEYFYILIWIQAIVLLIQGTLFAWSMASREKTNETLDFHRNSPQAVRDKIFGLVFGSTWLEWAIFVVLFLVELPFAVLPKVNIREIFLFNASLFLSGLFFHITAVTLSLIATHKKRGSSLLGLLLFLWFGGPFFLFGASQASPFFSHLLGTSALMYIFPEGFLQIHGWFYTFTLPLLVMQAMVQIPLVALMVSGMKRIFCLPNSPAWSKANVIRFCGLLLFFMTGFFVADSQHLAELMSAGQTWNYGSPHYYGSHHYSAQMFLQTETWTFVILFVAMGIIVSLFLAPTYFKCKKYAVLRAQGLIRKEPLLDDGATSLLAIAVYLCTAAVFFSFYAFAIRAKLLEGVLCFLLLSSYVLGFNGFLEYFRLSKFRGKNIFFLTILLVWWAFIPWIIAIFFRFDMGDRPSLTTLSPFFGLGYAISMMFEHTRLDLISFLAPWAVACLMWYLAMKERFVVEGVSKK